MGKPHPDFEILKKSWFTFHRQTGCITMIASHE